MNNARSSILVIAMLLSTVSSGQSQSVHAPFDHWHSNLNCGSVRGVCYGFAMGRANGKTVDSTCNPATTIPMYQCDPDEWGNWSVDPNYWTQQADETMNSASGKIIIYCGGHVAFAGSWSNTSGFNTIEHVQGTDYDPVTSQAWRDTNGRWFLTYKGGSLQILGYYKSQLRYYRVENKFLHFFSPFTDQGEIWVGSQKKNSGYLGSEFSDQSIHFAAISQQDYLYNNVVQNGYKQYFNNLWTKYPEIPIGSSLTLDYVLPNASNLITANFYQAVEITFAPENNGGVEIDGVTYYSPQPKYVAIENPALSATAIARNNVVNGMESVFQYWTNSYNADTTWSYSIAGTSWFPVTYTAHFILKPLRPSNIWVGGNVGSSVQVTWDQHPDANVTYQIWRRVKPPGEQQQDPVLMANRPNSTTSWTDTEYRVTAGYTDAMLNYDVRSYYELNATTSDPDFWAGVAAREFDAKKNGENDEIFKLRPLPTEYVVGNYPNPFNPSTTISFQLPEDASVQLEIYDMMGKRIAVLVSDNRSAGYYSVSWSGKNESGSGVASGMYLYRFTATPVSGQKGFAKSGKLLMMK
jgi:hypothetical protein